MCQWSMYDARLCIIGVDIRSHCDRGWYHLHSICQQNKTIDFIINILNWKESVSFWTLHDNVETGLTHCVLMISRSRFTHFVIHPCDPLPFGLNNPVILNQNNPRKLQNRRYCSEVFKAASYAQVQRWFTHIPISVLPCWLLCQQGKHHQILYVSCRRL